MPPTFENPFTPKSAIPVKRLFGDEKKVVKRQLSKEARERVKEAKERFIQYGDKQILKSQVEFLYEMEKQRLEILKNYGQKSSKEDVVAELARCIEVDEFGNIEEIKFSSMYLDVLPYLDKLTKLRVVDFSNNYLHSLPSLDRLTNLQKLDCCDNLLASLPNLKKLVSLEMLLCAGNKFSVDEEVKIKSQVPKNCKVQI